MWDDGYVRHIGRAFWVKGLEAVDVVGYDPPGRLNAKAPDTRRTSGLQAPRVLKNYLRVRNTGFGSSCSTMKTCASDGAMAPLVGS